MILGPCAGGSVYTSVGTDLVVMVDKTSHMLITGPEIVAAVTGEQVTMEELGGGSGTCWTTGSSTRARRCSGAA